MNNTESLKQIDSTLEKSVRKIIIDTQDLSKVTNKRFLNNPDDPIEHSPQWHQWGIITHSRKALEYYSDISSYIETRDQIFGLDGDIDGFKRSQLLSMVFLLHDLGKFSNRTILKEYDGYYIFSFREHEKASEKIIRSRLISNELKKNNYTDRQIEYIAVCAGKHFELGKLRKRLIEDGGYSDNTDMLNKDVEEKILDLIKENQEFSLEIGIMFLIDSLAKQEIHIRQKKIVQLHEEEIKTVLERKKLNSNLLSAVYEFPQNLALANIYLNLNRRNQY